MAAPDRLESAAHAVGAHRIVTRPFEGMLAPRPGRVDVIVDGEPA